MTRTEVFEASGPTSGTHVRVKLGATKDGRLVAGEAHLIYEAGAFPGSPVAPACHGIMGPYEVPNAWIEGFDVVVNKPKSAAYRAPGVPAAAYAMETAIDILCEKIGMDPLEFRLRNSAKEGTRGPTGPVWPRVGFVEVLQAAKDHPHFATPLTGPYRGRGVASGLWRNNTGPSSALAVVHNDGTVHLTEGSPDIGGTRASISQQFAETLGIPFEDVHPEVGHPCTGFTPVTAPPLAASFKTGWAAYHAAQDIKRQMCERAAKTWDVPVEKVTYEDGVLLDGTNPERRLTFKQVAARQVATGGPIVGRAGVNPPGAGASMGTHIVDVAARDHVHGQGDDPALRCRAGCRPRHSSKLCRGADPGWGCARYRLGAERGVLYERGGFHAEFQLAGLPHAYLPRSSDDRYRDRRSSQSESSLWGAWRGRNVGHSAPGRSDQRRVARYRCAHEPTPDVAGSYSGGPVAEERDDKRHEW